MRNAIGEGPRRAALTIALLLVGFSAHAACDASRIWDGAYRQTVLDAALDGTFLWTASSWGVSLEDASVSPPRPLRSIPIPSITRRIAALDGVAWAASGSEIFTVEPTIPLRVTSSVDLGSTIQDLLVITPYLYAATASGVVQLDLLDPRFPVVARAIPTTNGRAVSLARIGKTLYVAQGSATVDVISLDVASIPQGIGSVTSLTGSTAVSSDGLSRLAVSDGRRTEIFAGERASMSRIGSLEDIGAAAAYFGSSSVLFAAGQDSTIRAIDIEDPASSSILFEQRLVPTAGTSNRIERIRGSGDRLWVAAGDIGLATFDLGAFGAPFSIHSYPGPRVSSVVASSERVWASESDGGLAEYLLDSQGRLAPSRRWLASHVVTVHDRMTDRLLVSEGIALKLWDVASGEPAALSSASFAAPIRSAVLREGGSSAWVVLDDGTVWSADLSTATAVVAAGPIAGTFASIERNGPAVGLVEFRDEGSTRVHYFADGDLGNSGPAVLEVDGFATSSIALAADGKAAAITFRGLYLLDFVAGAASLTASANPFPAIGLGYAGDRLLVLRDAELESRDPVDGHVMSSLPVPPAGGALAVGGPGDRLAVVGAATGLTTVDVESETSPPVMLPGAGGNRYYARMVAGGGRLALFDGNSVDLFALTARGLGQPGRTVVPGGGVVGITATESGICALYASGSVRCFGFAGETLAEHQLLEGADSIPLGIHAVGGGLWVSVSSGCLSGSCRNDVIVLDSSSATLQETARLDGRIVDVVTEADHAWSVSDFPRETRVWKISDPLHPTLEASVASEGNPVAIARDASRNVIYTLGSTVVAWNASLVRLGTILDPWVADPSGRLSYIDQRMRIVGGCAVISGRTFDTQLFEIDDSLVWTAAQGGRAASPAKEMVVEDGRVYLLSEHGLEIRGPAPIGRRRAIRR